MDALARARAAKEKVKEIAAAIGAVNGIGIAKVAGKYAVKVNLARATAEAEAIPAEVDGVPVIVEVVGRIEKQRGKRRPQNFDA